MDRGVVTAHQDPSLSHIVTVAILAQGTSWAVAVTQAFLGGGSSPGMYPCPRGMYVMHPNRTPLSLTAIPRRMHRISSDLRS
jgi:hypothetical protein